LNINFIRLVSREGQTNFAQQASLSYRNGGHNTYTNFDPSRTISFEDQKDLSVQFMASQLYNESFREIIFDGQTDRHFVEKLHRRKMECCPDALATPSDFTAGGFLIAPMQFYQGLQRCCDKSVVMRQLATVVTVTEACKLGIRRLTKRMSSFAWGCECAPPKKCDIPRGDQKVMEPNPWTVCTSVCNALIRKSTQPYENILLTEMAQDVSENLERGYLYGDGKGEPLGILHQNGMAKSSDIPLKIGSLDPACLMEISCQIPSCVNPAWLMGKKTYCDILKLTNGCGDYYWWNLIVQNGTGVNGNPNSRPSLMGHPVYISEFIEDSLDVAGHYPIALADFGSSYFIADGPSLGIQKDTNIYTDSSCWVGRGHSDGMIVKDCDARRVIMTKK
jgi:HK97 family phage major capsid protein